MANAKIVFADASRPLQSNPRHASPRDGSGGGCSTSATDLPMGFATLLIAAGLLLGPVARRRT
ncbi:MAG: hypothetical protein HY901_38130 [Deltaproteobacteria bacterium]|nr:hypothetical protein [Deltaproteobacteria bacterium]